MFMASAAQTVISTPPRTHLLEAVAHRHGNEQSCVCVRRDRLSASDMLQVRKVMEHVYEKIINLDSESQTGGSAAEKPIEQKEEEDMAVLAEEKIELLCQDQVFH